MLRFLSKLYRSFIDLAPARQAHGSYTYVEERKTNKMLAEMSLLRYATFTYVTCLLRIEPVGEHFELIHAVVFSHTHTPTMQHVLTTHIHHKIILSWVGEGPYHI